MGLHLDQSGLGFKQFSFYRLTRVLQRVLFSVFSMTAALPAGYVPCYLSTSSTLVDPGTSFRVPPDSYQGYCIAITAHVKVVWVFEHLLREV